jgi:hypothetical protein
VNDDGPHNLESMLMCAKLYYPKLNPGGVLVIEDIPSVSWFDSIIEVLPEGTKVKTIDDAATAATDSRILIAWK